MHKLSSLLVLDGHFLFVRVSQLLLTCYNSERCMNTIMLVRNRQKIFLQCSFPKDENLRRQWLAKVQHVDWQLSEYSVICSEHFNNEDFCYVWSQKRLRPRAVPSVFSHY